MSKAHDPLGTTQAHSVPPPKEGSQSKMSMINVDSSGLSMSWKTAVTAITFVVIGMMGWNTFSASVVRSADLAKHNGDPAAHGKHPAHADHIRKSEVVQMIEPLKQQVADTEKAVIVVRNGFYDQRAEGLAYRAVDNLPETTGPRRRIQRFEEVRRTAKGNLEAGRPIRTGLSIAP